MLVLSGPAESTAFQLAQDGPTFSQGLHAGRRNHYLKQ